MADPIIFRARARGCAVEDNGAISAVEPRVKYVKGFLTGEVDPGDGSVECGDGTKYPLEITVDELSEIAYRVRDCNFTAGALSYDDGTIAYDVGVYDFTGSSLADYSAGSTFGDYSESKRGYCYDFKLAEDDLAATSHDPAFTASYGPSPFLGNYFRELADSEAGMWVGVTYTQSMESDMFDLYYLREETQIYGKPFGFNCAGSGTEESPSVGGVFAVTTFEGTPVFIQTEFEAASDLEVAYLDVTGSGDPFDPGNRLFLSFVFHFTINDGYVSAFSTHENGTTGTLLSPATDFSLVLSGSTVSCPLYYDGSLTWDTTISFTLTATKWWEYKDSQGSPVWDEDLGTRIN